MQTVWLWIWFAIHVRLSLEGTIQADTRGAGRLLRGLHHHCSLCVQTDAA